jgi:isoquinoline 1-oxidoreductase beta subunit
MGRARTIARRTFLIGSAAIAGGVAFGVYKLRTPHDNPLKESLREGEATFNPWVKVTGQGIILITPHHDMGQGVAHMQALLIAEEMDLDLGQFETSFGVPSAAYYNRGLADEAAPVRSTDTGFVAQTLRDMVNGSVKLIGLQATGGSSSTADSFDKLRRAGAIARETLKAAASARTGVAVSQLRTRSGAVVLPDETPIPYTELAADAAGVEPVQDVDLRDPGTWRLIGQPTLRADIVPKSTGAQNYTVDLQVEGMVHATLVRNPRKFGDMIRYDATRALQMRGVQAVLPVKGGVCVLADNTWRAFQASKAIDFEWGPAPYPAEQSGHWDRVAQSFAAEFLDREWRSDGDVEAHLAGELIEAEYRAPYVAHQPLEPLAAVVRVTDTRADVWISHQLPGLLQRRVASLVGLDKADVHIHNQFSGGGFGHRFEFDWIDCVVEAAAQVKGTPVKMTLRREEDFAQDPTRQIGMSRSRGAVSNGQVVAWDLNIATPSAISSQVSRIIPVPLIGPDMQIAAGAWNMPYAVPHLRVAAYKVPELAPISSWRSVGASTAGFFAESFLDELIHAAGADPMEERLRLCDHPVARKVLEAVAEMSDWGSDLGPNRGRGVALVESFGTPTAEVIEVTATLGGIRIDKVFVAADVGRVVDPVNFENQVQGAVIWGLGHAINSEITYADGMAEQDNYHMAEGLRLYQTPQIMVRGLENGTKVRGIGEPPVPPAAPALANAIFAATGTRLREMPFNRHMDFV